MKKKCELGVLVLLCCLFSQNLLAQATVVEEPILPSLSAPKTARIDHSVLTEILKRYVNRYGLVEYAALKRDKDAIERLKRYTQDLLQIDGVKLEPIAEKMAYWLNLYNALVLQKILEHYPINTVTLIPHFFDEPRYQLQGFETKLSLLDIEQKIFREQLPDPRLHLARVTGSLSGPPFLPEAYQSPTLEKKLEEVTKLFLTDTTKNFYDRNRNVFFASPIFLWFIDDFSRYAFSPLSFIQTRLGLGRGVKLQYSGYDWRLNDAKLR